MTRVYFIHDGRGERRVDETELPLAVGGADHGDLVVPGLPDGEVVAHIAVADGHAYIQPAETAAALYHNHERMADSKWLKSGDQVQVGDALLHWLVKGDQVFVKVRRAEAEPQLKPPQEPPPAAAAPGGGQAVMAPAPLPGHGRQRLRRVFLLMFTVLVLVAAFVLLATPMVVRITPEPATQSVAGFPPVVPLAGRLLALPGQYRVRATREGYRALDEPLDVPMGGFREYSFQLQELPGRVTVGLDPAVPFTLFVNDEPVPTGDDGSAEIERGTHSLRVETKRYLPEQTELEVAGLGKSQRIEFRLRPGWADVFIASQPAGARVQVDGETLPGQTPLETQVMHGSRSIVVSLAAHKPVTLQQEIAAGTVLQLDNLVLPPADGQLHLSSDPAAATIRVDGKFSGTTPATLTLASRQEHVVQLSKPGYKSSEERITLQPEQQQDLSLKLAPQYGTVFISADPADASLILDGKPAGKATRRLRLTTRPHRLEFRKPGYAPYAVTLHPRAGVSQNLEVKLKTVTQAKADATPASITTAAGQVLHLVRPQDSFRMGASRREAGRRANESRRLVKLTRPFYLGEKEVSNGEFRRFRRAHSSGSAEGVSLNDDSQPVAMVSWDDAARYCNWLSKKDGLPPAYSEQNGRMVAVMPATRGYRLPSEAEWAYVARVLGRSAPARYPWPGKYPPGAPHGNFADAQIADTLADVVPGYDDRFRGSAPVGSFAARPPRFHDLGGNVAEWTNDFYAVYPGEAERLVTDPTGPASGEHRVVRGSSWRHGNITELRLSYRDYSRAPRNDLGFRIARYAQ